MADARFRVAIVDDEPPARAKLRYYLQQNSAFIVGGEAGTGAEALTLLQQQAFSTVFLDVEMPDMSGFDVLRQCNLPPDCLVVFATAHDAHAAAAFEVQAFDYLVKPVSPLRFDRVLERIEKRLTEMRVLRSEHLEWRSGSKSYSVDVQDIVYVEAARNYLVIYANDETHIVRRTLDSVQSKLPGDVFTRISRSVIVNGRFVKVVEALSHGDRRVKLTNGSEFTWSRRYRS